MTTITTATDAAQFLSLVPRLLGFTPSRSVVIIPMKERRSLGALRVDIPPDDPTTLDAFAATVIGMICRIDAADGFIAALYTDESAELDLPHHRVVQALQFSAASSGLRFIDAFAVASDGWGSYLDARCPEGGRPLSELMTTGSVAGTAGTAGPAGPAGSAGSAGSAADQASGADLPPHTPARRRQVGDALRSLRAALEVLCGIPCDVERTARIDPAALAAACELDDLPQLYERALTWSPRHEAAASDADTTSDPARDAEIAAAETEMADAGPLSPMRVALLTWCLARPALRDVALLQWATDISGGVEAAAAQQRWEDGAEYPADLASVMWGEGRRPDPDRLESALALVRQVAASTPKKDRAGPLAVCAWLAWSLGRSTHADRYAQRALRIEPTHTLAEIVRSFVASAHLPDWAFAVAEP